MRRREFITLLGAMAAHSARAAAGEDKLEELIDDEMEKLEEEEEEEGPA
jgi:hypothetical protein